MSKKYKYIKLRTIEDYEGWDLVQIIPAKFENYCDMCVICADDTPQEDITLYADLINRQKAEIERLTTLANLGQMRANDYRVMRDKAKNARAEAIKEFAERVSEMITEVYNKHIFGYSDLSDEEKDAVINFSDDVSSGVENLVKEMTEGTDGES